MQKEPLTAPDLTITDKQAALIREASGWGCKLELAYAHARARDYQVATYEKEHPGFLQECEWLRLTPQIDSLMTVGKEVKKDGKLALDVASRLIPEYSTKAKVHNEGSPLVNVSATIDLSDPSIKALKDRYEEELRKELQK